MEPDGPEHDGSEDVDMITAPPEPDIFKSELFKSEPADNTMTKITLDDIQPMDTSTGKSIVCES